MITLNTKGVGLAGLAVGGTAIVASVGAFFKLLTSPSYLIALYWAISNAKHQRFTPDDGQVVAQAAAAVIAIVGAFVVAVLLSWLGMPTTVPTPPGAVLKAVLDERKEAA